MKKTLLTLGSIVTLLAWLASNKVYAVSTTGNVIQTVIAALAISNVSDLDFGSAPQGDAAKTVAPGSAEDAENGSFLVNGNPNQAYTITLPSNGTVTMITAGGGSADKIIAVDDFLSTPAAGANGSLDGTGAQDLFVGATRAALLSNQTTGAYTGTYTVTVIY